MNDGMGIDGRAYWQRQEDILSGARDRREAVQEADAKAERAARFAAEWTREITIARRAAWNEAVKSGRYASRAGGLNLPAVVKALGFHFEDLKSAVAKHGL